MRTCFPLTRTASATALSLLAFAAAAPANADNLAAKGADGLPAYMEPISGRTSSSPAEVATKDMLALNTGMFELYDAAAKIFQKNILSKHPVILGLFTGAGGRFILYRPNMPPLEAPSLPMAYQLLKSVEPQHDGVEPGGRALPRQSLRPILACADARLPQPHAVGARRPRRDAHAGGMAGEQPHRAQEQPRVHGRVLGEGLDLVSRRWKRSPRSRVRSLPTTSRGRPRPRSRIG